MLRRPAEKVLVNTLDANTITDNGDGTINVAGVTIPVAVISGLGDDGSGKQKCTRYCHKDCIEKKVKVTVDLADPSCGCVEEWAIKVKVAPDGSGDLRNIRPIERIYTYDTPANVTATNALVAAFIADAINADKHANFTAEYFAGDDEFAIIGKNCRRFDAYLITGMGTVEEIQPYSKEVLSADEMSKMFPIGMGSFGSRPNLPLCGTYCKFVFEITNPTQDLAHSTGWINSRNTVEFYVNSDAPTFDNDWSDKIAALFPGACTDCTGTAATLALVAMTTDRYGVVITNNGSGTPTVEWAVEDLTNDTDIIGIVSYPAANQVIVENNKTGDKIYVTVTFPGCVPITLTLTVA